MCGAVLVSHTMVFWCVTPFLTDCCDIMDDGALKPDRLIGRVQSGLTTYVSDLCSITASPLKEAI